MRRCGRNGCREYRLHAHGGARARSCFLRVPVRPYAVAPYDDSPLPRLPPWSWKLVAIQSDVRLVWRRMVRVKGTGYALFAAGPE
jgi:hypothetical protein